VKTFWRLLSLAALLLSSVTALAVSEEAVERNNVGARLLEQSNADAAIAEFQRALSLDPEYFPARLNLAYAYERVDRTEEAMEAYREAINLQPRNFYAHNNLGVLCDKRGLYDAAIREFETVLAIEPGNSMALKNLETARKNQAAMKVREAQIQQTEREHEPNPVTPRLHIIWLESMLSTEKKNSPTSGSPRLSSKATKTSVICDPIRLSTAYGTKETFNFY
jgi:tetratricopeptide (TPR) repeat protein